MSTGVQQEIADPHMLTGVQQEITDPHLNDGPPSHSVSPLREISPWLNGLESAHVRIEERISHLEAIISRIRERETTPTTTTPALVPSQEGRDSTAGVIHERSRERLVENGDRKTYLISKALNMDKTSSVPGGYFDCNICLEKAKAPILTCCGHLFCWRCFYQLPVIYLNIKECPVCDGEVTDAEVIPIYGNGNDCDGKGTKPKLDDCSILVPPRPNAKRVESVRQKIVSRGQPLPFIPGVETIEQFRSLQALAQGDELGLSNIITNGRDNGGGQQHHHQPFGPLRLLPPHMPPYPSFPGLVVDTSEMPTFIDVDNFDDTTSLRRNRRRSSRIPEVGPSPAVLASIQRNRMNNASQTISFRDGPASSSSATTEFAVPGSSTAGMRSQTVNPTEVVTSVSSASSSRSRADDVNNGPQTRSRRRLS